MMNPTLRFHASDGTEYSNWKKTTIGKIGKFHYGKSAPKWSIVPNGQTPCVRYGELYTKHKCQVKDIYSYTNISPEKLVFSKGGEVLIPRVGEDPLDFCKCSYIPFKDVAIGEMISIYETSENGLFISYLFNSTMKYEFAKRVEGGNVSNLYYDALNDITIHIPCSEEQQKIASFFSTLDQKIELNERKLEALEKLKKGLMQKIFSQEIRFKSKNGNNFGDWKKLKIDDVATIQGGGTPSTQIAEYWNGEIQWMTPTEINSKYVHNSLRTITKLGLANSSAKLLPKGSILLTTRATIGACSINNFDGDVCTNQGFQSLICKNNIISEFLYYSINHPAFQKEMKKIASGSTFLEVSPSNLKKITLQIPSIEEQKRISDFFSIFDKKINLIKLKINALKQIKQGLMQQMFV